MADKTKTAAWQAQNNKPTGSAAAKYQAMKDRARGDSLSWGDASPQDLMAAIVAVTGDGAAVLFSKTSDGGALVVRVLVDKESIPYYPSNASELAATLKEIFEAATS